MKQHHFTSRDAGIVGPSDAALYDRELALAVHELLGLNPAVNSFMLGNIAHSVLEDGRDQEILFQFSPDGALLAMAMRYHSNALFYLRPDDEDAVDTGGFARRISTWANNGLINRMNGQGRSMDALIQSGHLKELAQVKPMKLAILPLAEGTRRQASWPDVPEDYRLEWAKAPQWTLLEKIIEQKRKINEFIVAKDALSVQLAGHRLGSNRSVALLHHNNLVSSVASAGENSLTAVVVGVFTLQGYRGRGLASALTAELCRSLVAEGKEPVLFFENPAAARIYHRLGFEDWDDYKLCYW